MAHAKLSLAQAKSLVLARTHATDTDRKAIKKELFSQVKNTFGIPDNYRLTVETSNTASADYLAIKVSTKSKVGTPGALFELGDDGRWVNAERPQAQASMAARWFVVNGKTAYDALTLELLSNDSVTYADGAEHMPEGATAVTDRLAIKGDAVLVLMPESDFS